MLCKKCNHCGLCEGDLNENLNDSIAISTKTEAAFCGIKSCSPNEIGIAIDIGTTTIACSLVNLFTGEELFSYGQPNLQIKYGSDVIARISYALTEEHFIELHNCIKNQIEKIIDYVMLNVKSIFLSKRKGNPVLSKIVICGNTTMECFASGIKTNSLASYPFTVPEKFGFSEKASLYFSCNDINENTEIYFAPVVSAFVGGDTECAVLSSFDFSNTPEHSLQFLADAGTNCEMALYDSGNKKIICTSSSAGPAFEGQGIECGSAAVEGAIAKVEYSKENTRFICKTIADKEGESICGTGILSSINILLKNDFINADGEILNGQNKINLSSKVYISQKDIRAFQLAKSAVKTGLSFLSRNYSQTQLTDSVLFLAGGFGSQLDKEDAVNVKMFPDYFEDRITGKGNAALAGAIMLFDEDNRRFLSELKQSISSINLAEEKDFQKIFMENLSF